MTKNGKMEYGLGAKDVKLFRSAANELKTDDAESKRLNFTLTRELETKLNNYMLEVHKKLGRLPHAIKTKLGRLYFVSENMMSEFIPLRPF